MTLASRISASARLLGEDDLAALANRGLLRRARKDLAAHAPEPDGERDGRLCFRLDGRTVELSESLTQSRCDCPDSGICRHILACILHVAAAPAPPLAAGAPAAACGHELLALADADLRSWCGKALLERATRELASGTAVDCTDGPTLLARLPQLNVECRWMPGAGPDGMICSCHAPGACVHRVMTILAWQVQQGTRVIQAAPEMLAESGQPPRTREQIRLALREACIEVVQHGFATLGRFHSARFRTLSVAAHGVDLPRLERLARTLADQIDATIARTAAADDRRLLSLLANAFALTTALASPTPPLIGQHRAKFERMPPLDLVGVGALPWQAQSGFRGLTVYYWDCASKAWCTWTDTRPTEQTFDPISRAGAQGPWSGALSPLDTASSRGRLVDGWRSAARRLSGRPSSRYALTKPAAPADLPPPVERWSDLVPLVRASIPVGLALPDETAPLVLLRPAGWGRPVFREVTQELHRPVVDTSGASLTLVVPHAPMTGSTLRELERLSPPAGALLFARLQLHATGLAAMPISIVTDAGVHSLAFHSSSRTAVSSTPEPPSPTPSPRVAADDQDPAETVAPEPELPLAGDPDLLECLSTADQSLVQAAEVGITAFRGWEQLRSISSACQQRGLATLGTALTSVTGSTDPRARAFRILAAAWLAHCTRTQILVEAGSILHPPTDPAKSFAPNPG